MLKEIGSLFLYGLSLLSLVGVLYGGYIYVGKPAFIVSSSIMFGIVFLFLGYEGIKNRKAIRLKIKNF